MLSAFTSQHSELQGYNNHICEKSCNPSNECSGLLNTVFSMVSVARDESHTPGCLGIPFFVLNIDFTSPTEQKE